MDPAILHPLAPDFMGAFHIPLGVIMGNVRRTHLVGLGALIVSVFLSIPAAAQVDFSGEWAPRFYEDQPERVPGPELADYLGLPINEAARLRADSWQGSFLT